MPEVNSEAAGERSDAPGKNRRAAPSGDHAAAESRSAEFLAEASRVLASSLDYETTLDALARLVVPRLADWCAIDVLTDDRIERLAVFHPDPAKLDLARELQERYPPRPADPAGVPNVLRTGEPELYEEITDELLARSARDDEHLRVVRSLGLRSAIIVPLAARGRTSGAITLVYAESGRRYTSDDLAVAADLARRAASAVENARLYREAQEANRVKNESLVKLAASETRLRRIVDSNIIGIMFADLDGGISGANDAFLKIVGYTRDDLARGLVRWREMTPPEYAELDKRAIGELREQGVCAPFEKDYIRKDGSRAPVLLGAAMLEGSEREVVCYVIDLTERRRAQAAARQGEEQFRTLADSIPQLAWMAEADGHIFWYNRRWYDYTGTNFDEMSGWGWKKVHHPEHIDHVVERWKAALAACEPWEDTFPLRSKTGEFRRFLSRALPIRDRDGQVVRWFGTNTDVEDNLRNEEALRRGENRLRRLQEVTSDASKPLDDKIIALLELGRSELGMPVGFLAHVEGDRFEIVQTVPHEEALPVGFVCDTADTFCVATLGRDEPLAIEHAGATELRETTAYKRFRTEAYIGAIVRIDGKKWGTLCLTSGEPRAVPFTDADKDFLRLMAQWVGGELSRQRIERARRESEERMRALTDAMPQLVWVTDAEGNHLYYNQQWYDYTGLTEDESIGFGFALALHPEDKERTLRRWERAWRDGAPYEIEYRFYSKPRGEYRWFLGRATPVRDASGKIVQWVGTCTDIDDQKQMAAQLERMNAERAAMLEEVSTPVVPVLPGVLALPLIGSLDTDRMQRATEAALAEVTRTGAHTCILDITGARIIDSFAVANLANLVGALRLIGAEAIVTGVSAQAAQSLVGLGLDLAQVRTQRTLAQALSSVATGNNKQTIYQQGTGFTVNGTTGNTR